MMLLRSFGSLLLLLLLHGSSPTGLRPLPLRPSRPLVLRFQHEVGGQPLTLFSGSYRNRFGEPFSIQQFKYYISDIHFSDGQHEEPVFNEAHLVDEADSSTLTLRLSTALSTLRSIRFTIGVDSLANTSGTQTGDLDPLYGMFWTWNSGYIYARLEGISDSAHSPAHRFTWDVGGYRQPAIATRTIAITLPVQTTDSIRLTADLLKFFDGVHPLPLTRYPICHQPGNLAMQIADNYSRMFSITNE